MSYIKNNWTEGDIITAEKLNNIEEGVSQSNSVYEIELTDEELEQLEAATLEFPFTKDITEEDYLNIKNSNIIKLKLGENTTYFLTRNTEAGYFSAIYFLAFMAPSLSHDPQSIMVGAAKNENFYKLVFEIIRFKVSST